VNLAILQKQPWLIAPEAFSAIFSASRAFFDNHTELPKPPESACLNVEGGVGVVSIRGPMLRNPDAFDTLILGACDTEALIRAVQEAGGRDDVQALLLDIDSPGGSVNGTPELAHAVAEVSRQKYVYAFSAGQMCSAAYWVASQCDAIYATPSARVGSIGVILPVLDSSGAFEQAGLKMEVFAAGKFKSAGTPGTSLSDDQRDWLRSEVEEVAGDFRAAVLARGRRIPDEAMEGQTFSGQKAMRFNLAGVVSGRAEALDRLRRLHVRPVDTAAGAMTTPTIEDELSQARARVAQLEVDSAARESLLSEANTQITGLNAQIEAINTERQAEAQVGEQTRADLATARQTIESLTKRNTALESAEQDIERRASLRAAQIVAETGTQTPANVTPKGDSQTEDLVARFKAITNPKDQTLFWQSLTPQQQALILHGSPA
jgi:signal peptide peptidase SppA